MTRNKMIKPAFHSHSKTRRWVVAFSLATICATQGKCEVSKPAQSIDELQQQLEKVLKETHTPGLSIAIVQRDNSAWTAGLGFADLATSRLATAATLFRVGSITKGFVSLSILKLVSEGRLSLDDPVRTLIPEIRFENRWEASSPLRVVHLLEHTTGWDDGRRAEWVGLFQQPAPYPNLRDVLNRYPFGRDSAWPPGTRVSYNNDGPTVAAYIVEKITGERFENYVQRNFFAPLGMKTATFFPPISPPGVTLYGVDGHTVVPYSNGYYRPAGSLNASADDMAAYLHFYLQRGAVHGVEVVVPASIDRMEVPLSSWAAKDGLMFGYGLGNFSFVHEGFVYHGHTGGAGGDNSEFAYLPDQGVGYFYSVNSDNFGAFARIGEVIRAYLTRDFPKPLVPSIGLLSAAVDDYAGWYEPDSPRYQWSQFRERLLGMAYVWIAEDRGKMNLKPVLSSTVEFFPVTGRQFRFAGEPQATVALIAPEAGGKYIQVNRWAAWETWRRIPAGLAVMQIVLTVFVLLSALSIVLYAPCWLLAGLSKRRRRPRERALRAWPLVAMLALAAADYVFSECQYPVYRAARLASPTVWSVGLCALTIFFAVASLFSAISAWRASEPEVRRWVRIHSAAVSVALLVATGYLAFWGLIGFRSWIQL